MTTKATKAELADRLEAVEGRLHRLEAWVAGTEYFHQEDRYPLAGFVAGDTPFAGLPDKAVPAAAASPMPDPQEAYLAALRAQSQPVGEGTVEIESYPLRLGGKGLFVADVTAYPKDLGYLLRSVEEKPEAVLHRSLESEGLLLTPPHQEGLYWVDAVWVNTPDPEAPPRWKATLVALTIRLDRFRALQEPTHNDDPFF